MVGPVTTSMTTLPSFAKLLVISIQVTKLAGLMALKPVRAASLDSGSGQAKGSRQGLQPGTPPQLLQVAGGGEARGMAGKALGSALPACAEG